LGSFPLTLDKLARAFGPLAPEYQSRKSESAECECEAARFGDDRNANR